MYTVPGTRLLLRALFSSPMQHKEQFVYIVSPWVNVADGVGLGKCRVYFFLVVKGGVQQRDHLPLKNGGERR